MLIKILVIHAFVVGLIGLPVRLYVAGFLLSTESVRSPQLATRIFYKYFVFSLYYMISLLFTPIFFFDPVLEWIKKSPLDNDIMGFIYLLSCVPLAWLAFHLDCRFMAISDRTKIRARERLVRKFDSK